MAIYDRNRRLLDAYTALRKALLQVPPIEISIPDQHDRLQTIDAEKALIQARKLLDEMPGDGWQNAMLVALIHDWLTAMYMLRTWHRTHQPIHGELVDAALAQFTRTLGMIDEDRS